MIRFLDVGFTYREMAPAIDEGLKRVLTSGHYVLGAEVESFEREFGEWISARHCVGVNSGLDALVLGLRALGVGPKDEVIVPANTFIATWLAVSQVGALLVPVDADPMTRNIDIGRLEAAVGKATRAIVPVHLYGRPVELPKVLAIARKYDLRVLDDAAQAHGTTVEGKRVGGAADLSAFSFYPTKNLGAFGDGGAVTTNDDALAERVRLLRNYGSRVKYHHEISGINSRLDPIQAAVLRAKLGRLTSWNETRRLQAKRYLEGLANSGVVLPGALDESSWYAFVIECERRAALQEHLSARGIETLIHYPISPHLQPAYAELGFGRGSFPVAESLQERVLSLPIGPHLSLDQVDEVIQAINSFFGTRTADG